MKKLDSLKKEYEKALRRFEEILKMKKTKIIRDSAIKRFEIIFDLSWKLVKAYLEEAKGISCFSPKECFRQAFHQGLIDFNDLWIKMTDWRNIAVHSYSEKFADALYKKLPQTLKLFQDLEKKIKRK